MNRLLKFLKKIRTSNRQSQICIKHEIKIFKKNFFYSTKQNNIEKI